MTYRALCRHPQEHQRPTVPFEEWLEQVDQLYDEEPDVGPLAERLVAGLRAGEPIAVSSRLRCG